MDIAVDAARIRATYDFATPDSLLPATAPEAGADAFVTGDRKLQRFSEIEVLLPDDLC